ncbi:hypothetical protein, partial [Plastoroseomonas hellenica]|nr:hypothetical protein [Plastoroseomonas hellenica]
AGGVVASGGTLLPAVAAAAASGGATLAAIEAVGIARAPDGETAMHREAEHGAGVVLLVHADTPEKRQQAREILQSCGAVRVWEVAEA